MRDPIECVEELIGNPAFAKVLRFALERQYMVADDGSRHRVYGKMWTSDWWWEIQVSPYNFPNSKW